MAQEILGTGLSFPLGVDRRGGLALARDEADVDQAIALILGTAPGERPMRPEFGCGVHDLVFAPVDARTAARVEQEVRASLVRWEPRIEVRDVHARIDEADPSALQVSIGYTIKHENDPRNLVFPFYAIGATEE